MSHNRQHGAAPRRVAGALVVASVACVLLQPSAARADPVVNTPRGRVLVVTANLREAYGARDVAGTRDVARFVERVASLRFAPDVLLLQEVRHSSAAFVARRLGRRTGQRYVVAVDPGPRAVEVRPRKIILRETAIVINRATMRVPRRGGFVTTRYHRRFGTVGKPMVKKQAFGVAAERGGGLVLPLASVHLTPRPELVSRRVSDRLRRSWAIKVAGKLRTAYGELGGHATIGGDFNSGRCVRQARPCRPAPFWAALTGRIRRFRDSVQEITKLEGVDYIFTRGGVHDAGVDRRPRIAYSDHRFRWSLIGGDRRPPSRPRNLRAEGRDKDVLLSWDGVTDAGSGVAHYEIWRSGPAMDFRVVAIAEGTSFRDTTTYRTKRYFYYVRAIDRAHNASPRSELVDVRL